jgi:hypothetical protein
MHRVSDKASGQQIPGPKTLAVRTYRRIAQVLAERGAPTMTPARVALICRVAERNLVRALLADPSRGRQLVLIAVHGRKATRPGRPNAYR